MMGLCDKCGQPTGYHREPLTRRQREIYNWIVAFNRDFGYAPTFNQVAQHFTITLPTVHEHVDNLRRKGWLILPAFPSQEFTLVPSQDITI